jgi:type IV pilus assembly protein PilN
MTQINLLPWREHARQTKKLIFGIILIGCVVLSILTVVIFHIYLNIENNIQIERNNYLQSALDHTTADIVTLTAHQLLRDKIVKELNLITDLRKKSFAAVRMLNLLVKATPPTVLINVLARENKIFTIEGTADSDLETTVFIRNIEAITGFNQPVLNVIKTQKEANNSTNEEIHFQLKVEPQD